MSDFIKFMEGKKTHTLVVLAILTYIYSVGQSPGEGFSLSTPNAANWSHAMLIGAISTFKLGIENALKVPKLK